MPPLYETIPLQFASLEAEDYLATQINPPMKTYPFLRRISLALAVSVGCSVQLQAQTVYQGPLSGITEWTNSTNWVGDVVPDAIDASVLFTNTAATNAWTNDTITVGTITASNTTGNVVIGSGTTTTDILELATSSNTPTVFVNGGSTLFNYATTSGNQGFTKTGGGNLTFRFNTADNNFTGNINLNAGTLTVNQDGSLGDTNNDIIVNSDGVSRTNTFAFSPGNNAGTVTLNADRSITISNGLLQVQSTSNAISGVINGPVSGAGGLTLVGPSSAGSNVATANSYTLNGANSYAGQTTIQMGAKLTLGSGASISTAALSLSGGNGSFAQVDLGGNTQSVASITTASSTGTARTMIITNGTLNVGSGGAFTLNGINGTTVDMSGLTTFTFNGAAGNRNFTVTPDTVSATATNTNSIFLAGGSNSISAAAMTVGGAGGTSQGGNHQGQMFLGQVNQLSANFLTLGGFNGSGVVAFQSGITNGSLTLRGSNAVGRMNALVVGATSSGARSGAGTLNISNGTIDASISNTFIGIFGASSTGPATTSLLAMGGGSFDTINMVMATITNTVVTNASASVGAVFQQNGGTVKVQTLTMGQSDTAVNVSGPVFLPTYNLSSSNAVLRAQSITAGASTNYGAGTIRKINFGAGTIQNYDAATDLTISGKDTTASGRIEIAVASNSSTRTFYADAERTITLEPSAVLTFAGSINKAGPGTLVLEGANVHTGNTAVSEGTLEVTETGSLAFTIGGNGTNNSITGTGTAVINGQFVFNLAGASTNAGDTWNIVAGSLAKSYGTNFVVSGFNGSGGLWTNTTNGVDYVFSQSSGNLTVGSVAPPTNNYASWVTFWETSSGGTFTNTAGTDDPDGDGFVNNLEFAFDGNPTVGTPALMEVTPAGTNAVFSWIERKNPPGGVTYVVQKSSALTNGWSAATGLTISNSLDQTGILIPADYERKEFEVPASGKDFYRVQGTINN